MKPCPSYPGYFADQFGGIWSKGRWGNRISRRSTSVHRGFEQVGVHINGKTRKVSVHILVLDAFKGPRPTPKTHAKHKDHNNLNNRLENLYYRL